MPEARKILEETTEKCLDVSAGDIFVSLASKDRVTKAKINTRCVALNISCMANRTEQNSNLLNEENVTIQLSDKALIPKIHKEPNSRETNHFTNKQGSNPNRQHSKDRRCPAGARKDASLRFLQRCCVCAPNFPKRAVLTQPEDNKCP